MLLKLQDRGKLGSNAPVKDLELEEPILPSVGMYIDGQDRLAIYTRTSLLSKLAMSRPD